jgi:endonuclease I
MQAALAELNEASRRPYYEKANDERTRDEYYDAVDEQLQPPKLFKALSKLLSDTHDPRPAYKPGKELYPWVDLQEDLKIRSIYSQQEFDPEELIREDFRIDSRRAELQEQLISERLLTEGLMSEDALEKQMDFLEAMLPYNCEHVVCQSWFDKEEPMRGDLHHLFSCEVGCNSFRGNQHFFQFAPQQEVVRNNCGRREENLFEPGSGKGAVARATLYFLLRYPGTINSISEEYDQAALEMLIQWHKAEPVTKYEKHRNVAIFERQGNRNPLIDRPEWATRIKFSQGL